MFEQSRQKKGHIDMVFKRYDGRTKPRFDPVKDQARRDYLAAKGKYTGGKGAKKKQPAKSTQHKATVIFVLSVQIFFSKPGGQFP